MTENPYEPPEVATLRPMVRQPLLPLWRRVVSVALLTLGGLMAPYSIASPVATTVWAFDPLANTEWGLAAVAASVQGLIGLVMIWGGIRLRKAPQSPPPLACLAGTHSMN